MKYKNGSGVECTPEEEKLINTLKWLAKNSWSGSMCAVMKSWHDDDIFSREIVEHIYGISNDGGNPNNGTYLME